jgi:DNA primase
MNISFHKFLSWAEDRFGDVVVKGDEIKVNSIFKDDFKHHMWCSPSGGKDKRKGGVFHCWKSEKSGSLITLVRLVDKCTYEQAIESLGGTVIAEDLNKRIDQFYSQLNKEQTVRKVEDAKLKFPEHTYPINSLPENHIWRVDAEYYLLARNLSPKNFLICTEGEYRNRIIIPYYDRNGTLIYWNARLINDSPKLPKYQGPKKEVGIGKSDVIYMAGKSWPQPQEEIYITEGEFDAETLFVCGFHGTACGGKEIYDKQIEYIRDTIPVICVDTDKAGYLALLAIGDKLISKGFHTVYYVRPPSSFKDWNEMLVKTSTKLIKAYINNSKKVFNQNTSLELRIRKL